jgi:23S rRNA (pseudouridine1915-N3)-methyltransferase
MLDMVEVEERRRLSGPELVAREGELLLAAIPRGATLVAMDPRGAALSSEDLAARLGRLRDEGASVAFAIGGADGLSPEVLRAARLKLSLGAMTWPHMLARVMLAEQLFRAQSILSGHPYHRG